MRDLLQFLNSYGHIALFVLLQVICFQLIVNFNDEQGEIYTYNKGLFTSNIQEQVYEWNSYLSLRSIADSLAEENASLRSQLRDAKFLQETRIDTIRDSLLEQQYVYRSAVVISNSINRQNNYMLVNRGGRNGIRPGMGVIAENGIVGVVSRVSEDYARVVPLHNLSTRISVLLPRTGYFGGLTWTGRDIEDYEVRDVPRHALITQGDSITTSGYSIVFPKGIYVGTVKSVIGGNGTDFLSIKAALNNDLSKVQNVYIVENLYAKQQNQLLEE